ncbi:MAG: hypothetical protein JWL79_2018 [Frankiales bacterium]|nr:hypothetical protein [Frankiales bacterium]
MRRLLVALTLLAAGLTVSAQAATPSGPAARLLAGAATVDATWHVGASAGQYASTQGASLADEWDPNVQHVKNASSYGVASRLSVRAIVLQNPGSYPVALVKDDNYLSQDLVIRRAAQLLATRGSKVTYEHLLVSATHDHNSPYYSTPAAGVWLFQDAMDLRMLEYQARAIATAVQSAEKQLRPARLGAVVVPFSAFQGNIAGSGIGEDGAPVGYPLQENDHGATVIRIDGLDGRPIATYANYAEHGESLDGYDLISGDWVAPFERYVDRATGAPVVFSQGSVGSAEGPYEHAYPKGKAPLTSDGVPAIWAHLGYAQAERGAHLLAEAVIGGWRSVRMSSDVTVAMLTHWVPGPVSHPYPSVSNCRSGPSVDGNPGAPVLGLPDCARASDATGQSLPAAGLYDALKAAGLPVPASYDATSFGSVEENARLKLQAVRLGSTLLASCACEPQSDLIKALETRTDQVQGNRWNGFDVGSQQAVSDAWPGRSVRACFAVAKGMSCPDPRDWTGAARAVVPAAAFAHMEAEINNPADGWDDPAYAAQANSEPTDVKQVKGNFTGRELPARCGYAVSVGLGHTGDYNGYTVSYREYLSRDSYRKALTAYGPHTADYMVTRLMSMASALSCGTAVPDEPLQALVAADEQRQNAEAVALGQLGSFYLDTWNTQLPDSLGPAAPLVQPRSLQRFGAATFRWVGGDTFTDNPTVTVQRRVGSRWVTYADQSGEVQVVLDQPASAVTALADNRSGKQRWTWTASFEAYDAFPRTTIAGGQVPSGSYRFVVAGRLKTAGVQQPYSLVSQAFSVSRFTGLTGSVVHAGSVVRFVPKAYPRTYTSPIRFVGDDKGGLPGADSVICKTCTFRPWAVHPSIAQLVWTVVSGDSTRHVAGDQVALRPGETAFIAPGALIDTYGETNSSRIS